MSHNDSQKLVTFYVNGKPKEFPKGDSITYAEVVALAFPGQVFGPETAITVVFSKAHQEKPKGSLVEGGSVKVKEGMEFDVSATNRS